MVGVSLSGKTTTIENILQELSRRRYSVGTVKEIHFEDFSIDKPGTNTYRHHQAGAQLVTARGFYETDILFKEKLDVKEILKFYDYDYVILEGVEDFYVPKIITAITLEEIEEKFDETAFMISGRIADEIDEYKGLPVLNALEDIDEIVKLINDKVFRPLPNLSAECCSACGFNCQEMVARILKQKSSLDQCQVLNSNSVKLSINGQEIKMVPFVQDILSNSVQAVVKELDGYQENATIEIKINK